MSKSQKPGKRTVSAGRKPSPEKPEEAGFTDLLRSLAPYPAGNPAQGATRQGAPLVHLDYERELKLKDRALQMFWQSRDLPGTVESIQASPLPRKYRTTSKRRALWRKGTLFLHLAGEKPRQQKSPFLASPLEPDSHSRIYRFLREKISEPPFRLVAKHLNHLIIRGSYAEHAVIFNVDTMNGPLVRKLKLLARHVQDLEEPVVAAFAYPDPQSSSYYLEARRPSNMPSLKRLFGRQRLMLTQDGYRFLFHPTSFCQVNESMVPLLLQRATSLLSGEKKGRLLDLYCGFGLFSHYLAEQYKQVVGVDSDGSSIEAAKANKRLNPAGSRTQFRAGEITSRNLEKILPAPLPQQESILLDPPRQGPDQGVIPALARRDPARVLHIHCNADLLPRSVRQWLDQGYHPDRLLPLDMFPGTTQIEVILSLTRK